jgi:hypothetical protein
MCCAGVPAAAAMELVRDALDSIEFVTGAASSTWGRVRAAMGHPEPWALNYVAIGNEDCGKPWCAQQTWQTWRCALFASTLPGPLLRPLLCGVCVEPQPGGARLKPSTWRPG